jgi:hypothetical protein
LEAVTAFRLNHFAHKFDADKIDSFGRGILFVSIGEIQRIASNNKFRKDSILNVYIIGNDIDQKISIEITRNPTDSCNLVTISIKLTTMNSEI